VDSLLDAYRVLHTFGLDHFVLGGRGSTSSLLILDLHVKHPFLGQRCFETFKNDSFLVVIAVSPEIGELNEIYIESCCVPSLPEKLCQIVLLDSLAHIEREVKVVVRPEVLFKGHYYPGGECVESFRFEPGWHVDDQGPWRHPWPDSSPHATSVMLLLTAGGFELKMARVVEGLIRSRERHQLEEEVCVSH